MLDQFLGLVVWRNGAPGQNELSEFMRVIDIAADGVPELRSVLPFVNQAGSVPFEESRRARLRGEEVLFGGFGVVKIKNALRRLF